MKLRRIKCRLDACNRFTHRRAIRKWRVSRGKVFSQFGIGVATEIGRTLGATA